MFACFNARSMSLQRRALRAAIATLVLAGAAGYGGPACAASDKPYPSRPVRIVVPLPAGGPADAVVRLIAERLTARLEQPFVPDFRGGAAGIIGTDAVAKAEPDGYTVLAATSDMLVNNVAAFKSLPYDPQRDLKPITQIGSVPLVFAVNPSVPAADLREFAAWVRSQPPALSYGSWGHGINAHLAGEVLLNVRLGARAVHSTYRGLAPLTQDLVGRQITAAFGVVPAFGPFAADGRLKVLGVTGKARVAALPDVKTFAEQGFDDEIFQARVWMAFLVPARTPRAVIDLLHREITAAVAAPEVLATLTVAGFERVTNTPDEADAQLRHELRTIPRLAREIGLVAQ